MTAHLDRLHRHARQDVADCHPEQERCESARKAKRDIKHRPPDLRRPFAAKLHRHRAEDQREEEHHEWRVEAGKGRRIRIRKRREQRPAERYQPDLIAVPERPDRVHDDPPLLVAVGAQVQNPDAKIEPIEHRVPEEENGKDDKPEDVEIHESAAIDGSTQK